MPDPIVPVPWGELFDKISILRIKQERLSSEDARANVSRQLARLEEARRHVDVSGEVATLAIRLKEVNSRLWVIEDEIRTLESKQDFSARFIELARAVYHNNDERGRLKRAIDALLKSEGAEEKQYVSYGASK